MVRLAKSVGAVHLTLSAEAEAITETEFGAEGTPVASAASALSGTIRKGANAKVMATTMLMTFFSIF